MGSFKCKKLSTKTFALTQKYLQKLKDIKKERASMQKAAELKGESSRAERGKQLSRKGKAAEQKEECMIAKPVS